jgi:HSP20 family protein
MALPTRVYRNVQADPFELAQREFESMFNRYLGGREEAAAWAPYAVDIREDADHFYVDAELPGFRKEDVDITLENQTLTISAHRSAQTNGNGGANPGASKGAEQNDGGQHLLHERRYTRFQRSFTLPPTVNEQSVQAKLSDGVLHITLNKREETKPRKISVS